MRKIIHESLFHSYTATPQYATRRDPIKLHCFALQRMHFGVLNSSVWRAELAGICCSVNSQLPGGNETAITLHKTETTEQMNPQNWCVYFWFCRRAPVAAQRPQSGDVGGRFSPGSRLSAPESYSSQTGIRPKTRRLGKISRRSSNYGWRSDRRQPSPTPACHRDT